VSVLGQFGCLGEDWDKRQEPRNLALWPKSGAYSFFSIYIFYYNTDTEYYLYAVAIPEIGAAGRFRAPIAPCLYTLLVYSAVADCFTVATA
jgi:hypothetical protein